MNLYQKFNSIHQFLAPFKSMWSKETLNSYPITLEDFPSSWIEELKELSDHELWLIDSFKEDFKGEQKKGSVKEFFKNIRQIIDIEKAALEERPELPNWAFIKVGAKKKHEIEKISQVIKDLKSNTKIKMGVDIGGGVGHLSRVLAHYFDLEMKTIDANPELHLIGKKRLTKFPLPEKARAVHFETLFFNSQEPRLKNIFRQDSLTIGLHTCGNLAVEHIKAAEKYQVEGVLNFGCCYAKMDPLKDIGLSQHGRQLKMHPMTTHALTLATRGYSTNELEDFNLKKRVKSMRYTLHLLLYHQLGHKEFLNAGEIKPAHYWRDFSWYAKTSLEKMKVSHSWTDGELNQFFNDPWVQEEAENLFLANMIRWQLGRVVELYILLDRALYLEEVGYHTTIKEYFEERLSPRNLGILAIKKGTLKAPLFDFDFYFKKSMS